MTPTALTTLIAIAVRDIERVSPALGRIARAAIENYNAEMARINSVPPAKPPTSDGKVA